MLNFHTLDNTTRDTNNQTEYMRFRYNLIRAGEAVVSTAYLDTKGIPTIGIGFNLQDVNILKLVLNAFSIDVSPPSTALTDFQNIVNVSYANKTALQSALNDKIAQLAALVPPQADRTTFAFSSGATGVEEMRSVFDTAVLTYENSDISIAPLGRVDNWLAGIPPSKERAVLASR